MSSQARSSREEQRRLSVRTLVIASVASATAALVTSQFWAGGTPIAAAVTPVIVSLVSELLNRPATKIVERFTVETNALPDPTAVGSPPPLAGQSASNAAERTRERGRGRGPVGPTHGPAPAPSQHGGRVGEPGGVRIYRSGSRRLPWKLIAATAALAFVIGVAILTVPELIAGQSLGAPDGKTTYFGGGTGKDDDSDQGETGDQRRRDTGSEQQRTTPEQAAPQDSEPDQARPQGKPAPDKKSPTEAPEPAPAEPPSTAPAPTTPAPAPAPPPAQP